MARKKIPIKDSYLFYRSFYEATKHLSHETLGKLYIAICEYGLNQKIVDMDEAVYPIFTLIKPQLDANYRKWIAGFKGGNPKGLVNNPRGRNQYSKSKDYETADEISLSEDNHTLSIGKPEVDKEEGIKKKDEGIREKVNVKEKEINILPSSHKGNSVISLPLNAKNKFKNIYEEDLIYYSGLYPNVDILQEFRNMLGWLNANPTKRKTERGIDNFINTWLMKNQDKWSGNKPSIQQQTNISISDMQAMKGTILND